MGVRKWFSGLLGQNKSTSSNVSAAKNITGNISGYITELSQWDTMCDCDVYEQMYIWEGVTGGAIDRVSSLVKQSVLGFVVNDVGDSLDPDEIAMRDEANKMFVDLRLRDLFESITEVMMIHGNVFMLKNDDNTLTILPNKYCALVEGVDMVGKGDNGRFIMKPTHLALNEYATNEMDVGIYPIEKIEHIRYKDTPLFMKDERGRRTYGVYAVSPLHRTVLPLWWKRQIMLLDVMLRWKLVPREHHKIDSAIFSLAGHTGSQSQRIESATKDAENYIANYIKGLKDQMPDQGYVTTDSVSIDIIQAQRGTSYTDGNELLAQLDSSITAGLNIPMSMVNGQNAGSFASELVISNYVSSKIIQIAERIKPVILNNIRARLPQHYPLDKLDLKVELVLANSQIELYRTMTIMASMGIFTDTEIREMGGWEALTEEQREFLVQGGGKTAANVVSDYMQGGSNVSPDYPETSQSNERHNRDASDNVLRND